MPVLPNYQIIKLVYVPEESDDLSDDSVSDSPSMSRLSSTLVE